MSEGEVEEEVRIEDVMIRDVAYVTVPGTREDILKIFRERKVSGVPVVKEGRVVGVVTREDLLKNPNEEQIALLMKRNPVTITPKESIREAARRILSHRIRRLPVVVDDRLVGIVSIADLIKVIAEGGYEEPISKYMEDVTPAIWDEMPLPVAARIMELARVRAVPVLNSELNLVGIITDQDLISAAVIEDKTEHSALSFGTDDDAWKWESMRDTMKLYYSVSKLRMPNKLVKEVMVREVVTATKSSGVSECARKMSKNKFDQLPVVTTRGKLIGMIRDRDLLKVLV
ncbi:MAG: CBS domain-containing protein [Candidatus Methanospirareceae archaeon]